MYFLSIYAEYFLSYGINSTIMNQILDFLHRSEAFATQSEQSLSTLSRKLLNDGKGLERLKNGGQLTLKTLSRALERLEQLEADYTQKHSAHIAPDMSHLDRLEAEAIHIMREVVAECQNPVMLYSVGKDSSVMLHLAEKAFYPAHARQISPLTVNKRSTKLNPSSQI